MRNTAVLMPVYFKDSPEYLSLAIGSVFNQTCQDFDLILCIDGKLGVDLDRIISSYKNHDRTHILAHSENKGLAFTLNKAIEYVLKNSYKYAARMDSDDIIKKKRLDIQLNYLELHPEVDAVGSEAIIINRDGNFTGVRKVKNVVSYKDLLLRPPIIHATVVFRTDFFKKVGLYDPKLLKSQDYDLWFRALKNNLVIHNIQEPLYYFRIIDDLIWRRKEEQRYNIRIKKKYLRGYRLFFSVLPNFLAILLPFGVIKFLVNKFMYKNK